MRIGQLLIILFVLGPITLNAQNESTLLVEYNLYTDQITYKRGDKIIKRPSVRNNENISVVLTEFNPYITKANLSVQQIGYNQSSALKSIDDFEGGGSSSIFSMGNLLGNFSLGGDLSETFGNMPGVRGASSVDVLKAKSKFNSLLQSLVDIEERLNIEENRIKLIQQEGEARALALSDISSLKKNTIIRPSRIRELIKEEIFHAFAKQENEKIDIDDVLNNNNQQAKLKSSLKNYERLHNEYDGLYKDWQSFSSSLSINPFKNEISFITHSADSVVSVMNENLSTFKNNPIDYSLLSASKDVNSLAELRQAYEEIESNNFTHTFPPIQVEGDIVEIEVSIDQIDNNQNPSTIKTLNQKIPVAGSWKITGSVGLNFGVFKNKTYNYSVVNESISANEKDDFIPIVASFAHFYKERSGGVNLGGSFGIGLPILGGNSIQSASFFLGPTLIVGKNQRFLLSAGVMGAKVERLSNGFEAGDFFAGPSESIPTFQKYELGYFLGISFNIIQ